jgi:acetolactate synthase-1/3 small subunit
MKKVYNISLFTENSIGILNRITIIFTRRHLNIDSITASECEVEGVYRYTIVLETDEQMVKKVVNQIEKQVDVLKAFYHSDDEVIYQEMALYKLATKVSHSTDLGVVLREHGAVMIAFNNEFTTLEKTGTPQQIRDLFDALKPFGVLEYARSGRVAISKPMKKLEDYLNELN